MFVNGRNIATAVVLSIITCGLYPIYWIACMADDINALERNEMGTSGGMVVVLTILSCGLYLLYYMYMASKRVYYLFLENGMHVSDNSIVNLLLMIASYFIPGAYIVAFAILQNDLNTLIQTKGYGTYR